MGWRTRDPVNSSSRVKLMRTGRRARRASSTVMKSMGSMSILPPKLPPMGGCTTVIRFQSRPSASARALRYMNTMCTPVHTVRWPSASKLARQVWVSIDPGADSGDEYMPSTTTAARLSASASSPCSKSQRMETLSSCTRGASCSSAAKGS